MPTVLTSSQQTFVDITDQRKLSAYITSNLPKTQSEDPNVLPHTYAPSWASTHLVLTPVVFLDQTSIALGSSGLTITWKRKDGTSAETAVTSGESVSGGILTVSQNKLAASSSGMITYICYISYYDSETKNTVNISSDITFTLVRNAENAKLAYVTADTYVFKYHVLGTHEPIISLEDFNRVQAELERRNEMYAPACQPSEAYPFTSLISCAKCGKHFRRKSRKCGAVWICPTYDRKGKAACPAKQIPDSALRKLTAGMDMSRITGVTADDGNRLIFAFDDGTTEEKIWKDPSRADSWTPEMRKKAAERTKVR